MRLTDRDLLILREIGRFRCVLGRHIKELVNFTGIRACDRRLKILIDNGYLERQKIIYGLPYIYTLTSKSKKLLNHALREEKIRIEQIKHDVTVIDILIAFIKQKRMTLNDVFSEKELHRNDGFGTRKHKPDFIFIEKNKIIAVEVELSLKSFDRLLNNIKDNVLNYDMQIWVIERRNLKLTNTFDRLKEQYANFEIVYLEDVQSK